MRKTICKYFWAWDFEKEENWLNEMAAKGLALVAVSVFKYTFEECLPGEYNVRLELLDNAPTHAESQQYIKFIEDSSAQYLGSVARWVYFRSKTDHGEFTLYSDNASRIKHLNRLSTLIAGISIMNICIGVSNISISLGAKSNINLIFGIIGLLFGLFVAFGFLRVHRKKRNLQKQQNLFE